LQIANLLQLVTPDQLSDRLWDFAARVGKVVDALPETRLGRHVASQLVRSGTSAAPNYDEGCAAESRADFVHKLSIALKELRESRGWLGFIVRAKLLPQNKIGELRDESTELCNILAQSIVTAKNQSGSKARPAAIQARNSQISNRNVQAPTPQPPMS